MTDQLFHLEIIAPDRIFYQAEAAMLELTTTEGEVGIYAGHIPMTYVVSPGIMTITTSSDKKSAALLSGFLMIHPDKIKILADSVEWPEEIDKKRAEEAKLRAQRRLKENSPSLDPIRAQLALAKALVRLRFK